MRGYNPVGTEPSSWRTEAIGLKNINILRFSNDNLLVISLHDKVFKRE